MSTTKTVSDPQLQVHISKLQTLYTDFIQSEQSHNFVEAMMDLAEQRNIRTQYPEAWAAFARLHNRNPDGTPLSV